MDCPNSGKMFLVVFLLFEFFIFLSATDVCSNAILLGLKGEKGDQGEDGELGMLGKTGPGGQPGLMGEQGSPGELGPVGKSGPVGERGNKGVCGIVGPPGHKGKPGTTCDCGRYRKVVGQMDITVGKLKNSVEFVKNVILGIKETDDKSYLIVKEARKFKEALLNCKLRGGTLAVPKNEAANTLIASYISQAGLTHAYIGLRGSEPAGGHRFTDNSPLQNFTAWGTGSAGGAARNDTCVEMTSTGVWSAVECDIAIYYVCEFSKRGRVATSTK